MSMTPQQLARYCILETVMRWGGQEIPADLTGEEVDRRTEEVEADTPDAYQDARNETRCGDINTGLPAPSNRHYEAKAVASQAPNGQWVGWTFWHGGGKYGEPEAIDWIAGAYHVDCVTEEKVVTVHTFSLPSAEK